jgi:hypothetical protein
MSLVLHSRRLGKTMIYQVYFSPSSPIGIGIGIWLVGSNWIITTNTIIWIHIRRRQIKSSTVFQYTNFKLELLIVVHRFILPTLSSLDLLFPSLVSIPFKGEALLQTFPSFVVSWHWRHKFAFYRTRCRVI